MENRIIYDYNTSTDRYNTSLITIFIDPFQTAIESSTAISPADPPEEKPKKDPIDIPEKIHTAGTARTGMCS